MDREEIDKEIQLTAEKYLAIKIPLIEFFELNNIAPKIAARVMAMFIGEVFHTAKVDVGDWDKLIDFFSKMKEEHLESTKPSSL